MPNLYIGTSGFTYSDWRNAFYPKGTPQKQWLAYYAQHYNAVEINATFYRPFSSDVYERWNELTPPGFRFVLKGPKTITHEKILVDVAADITGFISQTAPLGEKLAAVLWQFPASVRADATRDALTAFLPILPKHVRHVFEFRHKSWFTEDTYALLNKHNAGFVVNDSPRLPVADVSTGGILYMRFHGPGKIYDSAYSPHQLHEWADKIAPRLSTCETFIFFNNTMRGLALGNADSLRAYLTS